MDFDQLLTSVIQATEQNSQATERVRLNTEALSSELQQYQHAVAAHWEEWEARSRETRAALALGGQELQPPFRALQQMGDDLRASLGGWQAAGDQQFQELHDDSHGFVEQLNGLGAEVDQRTARYAQQVNQFLQELEQRTSSLDLAAEQLVAAARTARQEVAGAREGLQRDVGKLGQALEQTRESTRHGEAEAREAWQGWSRHAEERVEQVSQALERAVKSCNGQAGELASDCQEQVKKVGAILKTAAEGMRARVEAANAKAEEHARDTAGQAVEVLQADLLLDSLKPLWT